MNPGTSKKKIFIIVGIIALVGLAYLYISGGKEPAAQGLLSEQVTPEATLASGRVLQLLNQIQALHIDGSIFTDPAYQTLVDYTVVIPEQGVGRPNPFAPIPGRSPRN